MEAAIALAALVVVLALCLSGLSAGAAALRCADAAAEAARLAGRGDREAAAAAVVRLAPAGASLTLSQTGDQIRAVVGVAVAGVLPGLHVKGTSVAHLEGGDDVG